MKLILLITSCAIFALVSCRPDGATYSDHFDNIDIDEILQSDRLLNNYYNCLLTGQKCTPDGQQLRDILPDALQTKCAKCTEVQSRQSKKVVNFLIKNKVEMYKELEKVFDPNGEYVKAFADELKAEGIVLPD